MERDVGCFIGLRAVGKRKGGLGFWFGDKRMGWWLGREMRYPGGYVGRCLYISLVVLIVVGCLSAGSFVGWRISYAGGLG